MDPLDPDVIKQVDGAEHPASSCPALPCHNHIMKREEMSNLDFVPALSLFKKNFFNGTYLFIEIVLLSAVLGLHCCSQAFSLIAVSRGYYLVTV